MSDYTLAIVVGRVMKTPVLLNAGDGRHCALEIKAERKDGPATWVTAVVHRHQADLCVEFLREGSTVMVIGSLCSHGDELEITVDRVQFLDRKGEPAPVGA